MSNNHAMLQLSKRLDSPLTICAIIKIVFCPGQSPKTFSNVSWNPLALQRFFSILFFDFSFLFFIFFSFFDLDFFSVFLFLSSLDVQYVFFVRQVKISTIVNLILVVYSEIFVIFFSVGEKEFFLSRYCYSSV